MWSWLIEDQFQARCLEESEHSYQGKSRVGWCKYPSCDLAWNIHRSWETVVFSEWFIKWPTASTMSMLTIPRKRRRIPILKRIRIRIILLYEEMRKWTRCKMGIEGLIWIIPYCCCVRKVPSNYSVYYLPVYIRIVHIVTSVQAKEGKHNRRSRDLKDMEWS